MAHPFDNFEFGPGVVLYDIKTGEMRSPFLENMFRNEFKKKEDSIIKCKKEESIKKLCTSTMSSIFNVPLDRYGSMSRLDRISDIAAAHQYLLARSLDTKKFLESVINGEVEYVAFKDLEYGVECKFGKFGEESIVYPNMICAVADILARYW